MAERIGIAMVGCGQIAEVHLKAVAGVGQAHLAFAVDVEAERARAAADRYGAPRWSAVYDEALSDPAVDAVVLCLPHDLHMPYSVRAAEAGKHILVEKPMALSEPEARAMVAAADRSGVRLSVGQSTRYGAAHQKAREILSQGGIGRVVNVLNQHTFWIERLSTDWRRVAPACGGLYLPLFGSHEVDAMLWLLDESPTRVWGTVRSASPVSGGDSDGFIGLEFADGKVASLAFATRCRQPRREMVFVGTEGTLTLTARSLLLDGKAVDLVEAEDNFTTQMGRFIGALLAGEEVPAPGREVVRVVRTLDLVGEASEQGKAIPF